MGSPSISRWAVRLLPHQTLGFLDDEDASAGSVQGPPGMQLELEELRLNWEPLDQEEPPELEELLDHQESLGLPDPDEPLGVPLALLDGEPLVRDPLVPLGPPLWELLLEPPPPIRLLEEPPSASSRIEPLAVMRQGGSELSVTTTVISAVWPRGRVNWIKGPVPSLRVSSWPLTTHW